MERLWAPWRMEFIDARVSSVPTLYELAPGVAPDVIDLTAHEQRFREETREERMRIANEAAERVVDVVERS